MNILLHICCGPCTIIPLQKLREEGHNVEGFFFNPNIHPYREFKQRLDSLIEFAGMEKLPFQLDDQYGLRDYLRKVVHNEQNRCLICYEMRLEQVALKCRELGADAFTSTLLYSRYQKHELIREKGEQFAEKYGVDFHYEDFRTGWQEGIERSRDLGLYRQPYCGCIYSEQERYDKSLQKKNRKRS